MTLRVWFAATACAALIVALSAGARPWLGAVAGAFRPSDFAQDVAAAQLWIEGLDPYRADFSARHARVLESTSAQGYPFFPHPPFAIVVSWPFGFLPLSSAALVWYSVSLALLAWLALLLAEIVSAKDVKTAGRGPGLALTGGVFVMLLFWPPVLYNLEKGQFSILLALLLALAWRSLRQGQSRGAGALIGLATAVKVFPLLLGGYLIRRDVKATTWAGATALVLTGLPVMWLGAESVLAFLQQSQGNVSYWQTWPAVTYSIHGAIARLLIGGTWADAAVHAPIVARAFVVVVSVALVVIALMVTGRRAHRQADEAALFAAWIALLVFLNPLSMGHNGVLLALPIAFIARALQRDERVWVRTAWALGVLLVSIPRQTIFDLAPLPVSPARGLFVVALPMWGALLLFGTCMALATRPLPGLLPGVRRCGDAAIQGQPA